MWEPTHLESIWVGVAMVHRPKLKIIVAIEILALLSLDRHLYHVLRKTPETMMLAPRRLFENYRS